MANHSPKHPGAALTRSRRELERERVDIIARGQDHYARESKRLRAILDYQTTRGGTVRAATDSIGRGTWVEDCTCDVCQQEEV